jgi:hypothetical protein
MLTSASATKSATSAKSATKYISKLTEDIIHVHATFTTTTKPLPEPSKA